MRDIILVAFVLAVVLLLVVLLTDGRYFGKSLMGLIYDRFGPAIFSAASDREQWQALAQTLNLSTGANTLDVGTATGDLPRTWAARPAHTGLIVGVDLAPRLVARARTEARRAGLDMQVHFLVADLAGSLPFAAARFDVVTCLGLLETVRHPSVAAHELQRMVKPGGYLVLSHYRDRASFGATLSVAWYSEHLQPYGFDEGYLLPFRRSHDLYITYKGTER
jgi:ubiquinone/menaquinone biosynthesis C-methylase UbiE